MTTLSYRLKKEPTGLLRAKLLVCVDGPVRRPTDFYFVNELMRPFPLDLSPGFSDVGSSMADFRLSMLATGVVSRKTALSFKDIYLS